MLPIFHLPMLAFSAGTAVPDGVVLAIMAELHHYAGSQVVCLQVDGQDPSAALLATLAGLALKEPVLAASACTKSATRVVQTATGKRATQVQFSHFQPQARNQARVDLRIWFDPETDETSFIGLKQVGSQWQSTSWEMQIVFPAGFPVTPAD